MSFILPCVRNRPVDSYCILCSLIQNTSASACSVDSYSEGWNDGIRVRYEFSLMCGNYIVANDPRIDGVLDEP